MADCVGWLPPGKSINAANDTIKIITQKEMVRTLGVTTPIKVILMGDPGAGKTTLIKMIQGESVENLPSTQPPDQNTFPVTPLTIDQINFSVTERNNPKIVDVLSLHRADAYIIVFDLGKPESLDRVVVDWIRLYSRHGRTDEPRPVILLGMEITPRKISPAKIHQLMNSKKFDLKMDPKIEIDNNFGMVYMEIGDPSAPFKKISELLN